MYNNSYNIQYPIELINCLKEIVQSSNREEVERNWKKMSDLEEVASDEEIIKLDYSQCLRDILKESVNIERIAEVLTWFSTGNKPITGCSDDIAKFLQNNKKQFKIQPCLVNIIEAIENKKFLYAPTPTDRRNLCSAIVQVLACYPIPNDPEKVDEFCRDMKIIRNFLHSLLNKDYKESTNNMFFGFKTMCEIMLERRDDEEISSALVIVIELIDETIWKKNMGLVINEIFLYNKSRIPINRKVVQMIVSYCKWLVQPPTSIESFSSWLYLFLSELELQKKQHILKEAAELILQQVFTKCLRLEKFYKIKLANNAVLLLLLSVYGLELFHKIIRQFGTYCFENGIAPEQKETMDEIFKRIWILFQRFRDHIMKGPCKTCPSIKELQEQFQLSSNTSYTIVSPQMGLSEMEVSDSIISSETGTNSTSKVGLVNLGNTCYMNSVLQALVMTKQFCHEVLLYKPADLGEQQSVLKNLQNLFALLKYSKRNALHPEEVLRASRPCYFMPGQQQDSSEFLCHLLDVMYEQEKSIILHNSNILGNDQGISSSKVEDKHVTALEESCGLASPMQDDGTSPNMTRWTTEENLSEGEELVQTQDGLSNSHSNSTDSGIQSVGGEDSTSSISSASSPGSLETSSFLVHRVFGGQLKVIYQCNQCSKESDNIDSFRDLQLCFLETLPTTEPITVQDLIKVNYLSPEKLTGDNKYRCENCAELCDAERIIKILKAPAHLILTLKHFRYDSESRLRTKLRRKVIYDETVQLPVHDQDNVTYQLNAAVVHSGYNMDYGHYITYACDSNNQWYKFNDSFVSETTIEDFKSLEPPDTPYILFYKKQTSKPEGEAPDLSSLSKSLQDYIELNRRKYGDDRKNLRSSIPSNTSRFNNRSWHRDDDEDGNGGPPTNCKIEMNYQSNQYLY